MKIDREIIRATMLDQMKKLGLDVATLAREAGVSYNVPREFLVRGNSRMPAADNMMAMLYVLNLTHLLCTPKGIQPIPVYGDVPGGDWREALQQNPDQWVLFPSNRKNLFGLIVRGTSVNKAVPDGGVAIIDPSQIDRALLANRLVVIVINRHGIWEATCKIYKQNPDRFEPYSTESHDTIFPGGDEWFICGTVVGTVGYIDENNRLIDIRNRIEYLKALEAA